MGVVAVSDKLRCGECVFYLKQTSGIAEGGACLEPAGLRYKVFVRPEYLAAHCAVACRSRSYKEREIPAPESPGEVD